VERANDIDREPLEGMGVAVGREGCHFIPMRPPPLSIAVDAEWDADAGVWVATSDDVPGLVAHHADLRALEAMVLELIPILLVENGLVGAGEPVRDLPVHIAAHALTRSSARIAA